MTGRPSDYTEEMGDEICARIAEGQSLRKICEADDMPSRSSVLRWLHAQPEFEAKCARARTLQADVMDDLVLETAEDCTAANFQASRVKIAAYQWRASRLNPKRFGDRTQLAATDVDGEPAQFAPIMFVPVEAKPQGD